MPLTRRRMLAGMAAGALARRLAAQSKAGAMRIRATPAVCLYSKVLVQISYLDLPTILQQIGFDGVDLSVEPGGHVLPEKADYNLMPALEAFTGVGLDVPMLTTGVISMQQKEAEQILGLATYIGVPFYRPGHWKITGPAEARMQQPAVQREIAGLAQFGRLTKMAMGVQNYLEGAEGAAVTDIDRVIRPIDPEWVGFDFDIGYASIEGGDAGFEAAWTVAAPRVKMVSLRDFKWEQPPGGVRKPKPCPLGEGVVDFPKFFAALAKARFAGPVSLQVDHAPGELAAIKHDLAFVRKQIAAAYGG